MTSTKMVDEIIINLDFPKDNKKQTLFVVFSSKEPHIEIVIDNIELIMNQQYGFEVVRLDSALKSGDSQYGELTNFLAECALAIVILDGFRPNVLFEYGILKGLKKPTIVLLEADATIDIKNFHDFESECPIPNPRINMDKHFSDVKDRLYIKYNKLDPKGLRTIIGTEYTKLRDEIQKEFVRTIFPDRDDVVNTLRSELNTLSNIYLKNDTDLLPSDEELLNQVTNKINDIATKNSITLPERYFFILAQVYDSLKKYEFALKILDSYIADTKNSWRIMGFKAHILMNLNRSDEALLLIEKAISYKQNIEFLWHNKALLLERLGRKKEALTAYQIGIGCNDGCPTIHLHYGIMLFENKKYQKAFEQFDLALSISPNDSVYLLWKGKSLYAINDKSKAFEFVEKAANLNPNNANAWYTLGHWEKNKSKSLIYYNNAIKADPEHCGAMCSKGAQLSNAGKFKEAFEIMWAIRDKCPRNKKRQCSTLLNNLLTTASKMDKKPSEEQMLELFVNIRGNTPEIMSLRASALAKQGKIKESIRLFNAALIKAPNDGGIWYNQACTYALSGNKTETLNSLKRAISLDPNASKEAMKDPDLKQFHNDPAFLNVLNISENTKVPKSTNRKKGARRGEGQKRQPTAKSQNTR